MDISQITDYLYVGGQPAPATAPTLSDLGVRLVISMRGERPPPQAFRQSPLSALWLKTYDTFFTPIPVPKLLEGVCAALPVIRAGGKVLAHCQHGRHRGPAMGAAILIGMGYSADEAMHLLRSKRTRAQPQAWYIKRQIRKFERLWKTQVKS